MKKTVKRILSAIMALAMIFACVPTAIAASTITQSSYNAETGTGYDDVLRIPYGQITTLNLKSVRGSKSVCCCSENTSIVNISDCKTAKAFAASCGATFVYVQHLDKNNNLIAEKRYIVVVYDNLDEKCTGKVTGVYADDISVKCGESGSVFCSVDTKGSVISYILADNETCNAVSITGREFYAYNKGTDTVRVYAVDTNGNVVETTITITVTYSFFQRIADFFRSLFSWIYMF